MHVLLVLLHALFTSGPHPVSLKTCMLPMSPPSSQLNFTLGALLQARGEDLYRMKGILAIHGLQERYVFQVSLIDRLLKDHV